MPRQARIDVPGAVHHIMIRDIQRRKIFNSIEDSFGALGGWSVVKELGMSLRELAMRLGTSPPGVGFSVERGEAIAHEKSHHLID